MRYKPIALAAAALAAGLAAAPARADLVPLSDVQLQGQGVGASFTVLFLQGQGASTTESGVDVVAHPDITNRRQPTFGVMTPPQASYAISWGITFRYNRD